MTTQITLSERINNAADAIEANSQNLLDAVYKGIIEENAANVAMNVFKAGIGAALSLEESQALEKEMNKRITQLIKEAFVDSMLARDLRG